MHLYKQFIVAVTDVYLCNVLTTNQDKGAGLSVLYDILVIYINGVVYCEKEAPSDFSGDFIVYGLMCMAFKIMTTTQRV